MPFPQVWYIQVLILLTIEILLGLGAEITYFNHNTASSYAFMLADIDLTYISVERIGFLF
jgi:hypothetical protein